MKQLLSLIVLLCVTVFFFTGCSDDDESSAPDSVYSFSTEGTVDSAEGTKSITIFTTCGWAAETQADWITIDPAYGDSKGIFAVHLDYEANTTGAARVGEVVFVAGTYQETYTLTQSE